MLQGAGQGGRSDNEEKLDADEGISDRAQATDLSESAFGLKTKRGSELVSQSQLPPRETVKSKCFLEERHNFCFQCKGAAVGKMDTG